MFERQNVATYGNSETWCLFPCHKHWKITWSPSMLPLCISSKINNDFNTLTFSCWSSCPVPFQFTLNFKVTIECLVAYLTSNLIFIDTPLQNLKSWFKFEDSRSMTPHFRFAFSLLHDTSVSRWTQGVQWHEVLFKVSKRKNSNIEYRLNLLPNHLLSHLLENIYPYTPYKIKSLKIVSLESIIPSDMLDWNNKQKKKQQHWIQVRLSRPCLLFLLE